MISLCRILYKCRYDDMWDVSLSQHHLTYFKPSQFCFSSVTLSEVLIYLLLLTWFSCRDKIHNVPHHKEKNCKYFMTHFWILHFTKDTQVILRSYLACQHSCFFLDYSFFSRCFVVVVLNFTHYYCRKQYFK